MIDSLTFTIVPNNGLSAFHQKCGKTFAFLYVTLSQIASGFRYEVNIYCEESRDTNKGRRWRQQWANYKVLEDSAEIAALISNIKNTDRQFKGMIHQQMLPVYFNKYVYTHDWLGRPNGMPICWLNDPLDDRLTEFVLAGVDIKDTNVG